MCVMNHFFYILHRISTEKLFSMGKKSKNLLYYSIFFRTVVAIIKRYKYDSISLSKTDKRNCLYYALKSKNALQTNMRGKMIQIVCKTEQYRTE